LSARGPSGPAKASAVRYCGWRCKLLFPMSFLTTVHYTDHPGRVLLECDRREKRGGPEPSLTSKPPAVLIYGLYPFNACDNLLAQAQNQSISHLSLSVRRSLCSLVPTHVQTCMEWSHAADAVYSVLRMGQSLLRLASISLHCSYVP